MVKTIESNGRKGNEVDLTGEERSVPSKNRTTIGPEVSRGNKVIVIPSLEMGTLQMWLVGDGPLMVNNKLNVAEEIDAKYSGRGKASAINKMPDDNDVKYAKAFYVLPSSKYPAPHPKGRYGVPTSGIKKCACKAIRTTGISDNTTIGLIGNSFWVNEDEAGFNEIQFDRLERDIRMVNIGSGQKTVPQMRHRPAFHGWRIKITVRYNRKTLSEEQIVNLFHHAGAFIGLCEMRAEKKQGSCGGFHVEHVKD